MRKKLRLKSPVVVEGKYDKIKLSAIIDSRIIVLDGFGVFKDKEKNDKNGKVAFDPDSAEIEYLYDFYFPGFNENE